ncbi:MAG: ATP synthase F1 subunit delta [Candidatus Goldiibacteriota bacterium]
MINLTLPKKYAEALFQLASEQGKTEEVKKDLGLMVSSLDSNKKLIKILRHPGISKDEKTALVTKEFKKTVSKLSLDFLCMLIEKKREYIFFAAAEVFAEKCDESNGIKKMIIETAYPLSPAEKNRVVKGLETRLKKKVMVDARVNKGILGGIIIKDKVIRIDASLSTCLQEMKNSLKAGNPAKEGKKRKQTAPKKKKTAVKKKKKSVKKKKQQ